MRDLVERLEGSHTKRELRGLVSGPVHRGATKREVAELAALDRLADRVEGHRGMRDITYGDHFKYDGDWYSVVDADHRSQEVTGAERYGDDRVVVNWALGDFGVFEAGSGDQIDTLRYLTVARTA